MAAPTPTPGAGPGISGAPLPPALTGGGGATTPIDWQSILNADPALQQSIALGRAQSVSSQASRDAAIRNAYEMFGDSSQNLDTLASQLGLSKQDLTKIIDPNTIAATKAAQESGVSTLARLQAANNQSKIALINALNARGILNSGETGYQEQQLAQGYQNSQFDARNSFLQQLNAYQSAYVQAKQAIAEMLSNAWAQAEANAYAQYGGQGGAGAATPPGATLTPGSYLDTGARSAFGAPQPKYIPIPKNLVTFKGSPQ